MMASETVSLHVFEYRDQWYVFDGSSMLLAKVSERLAGKIAAMRAADRNSHYTPDDDILALLRSRGLLQQPAALADSAAACLSDKEAAWKHRRLAGLQLLLTTQCHLRCEYCYAGHGTFGNVCQPPDTIFMGDHVVNAALEYL